MTKVQMFRLLASMNQNQGTSILLVSNDINSISAWCDSFSVLYCGQNAESGSKENISENPASIQEHYYILFLILNNP